MHSTDMTVECTLSRDHEGIAPPFSPVKGPDSVRGLRKSLDLPATTTELEVDSNCLSAELLMHTLIAQIATD